MRIIKLKTAWKVESQSHPGTWYFVNLEKKTCTCPEWVFRMKKIGGICKHINAVEEKVGHLGHRAKEPTVIYNADRKRMKKEVKKKGKEAIKKEQKEELYAAVLDYVKVRGEVDSIDIIERFGEEAVDDMLRLGELIEESGKIRVLE